MAATEHLWLFEAVDTWSFRDGRPFQAGEDATIESLFPPTGYTLMGAVRTAILRHHGVDPAAYGHRAIHRAPEPSEASLHALLGDADSPGQVHLVGPYLYRNSTWLFPAPLDLVLAGSAGALALLRPGPPVVCDLGAVCLPHLVDVAGGVKTLEGRWISHRALVAALAGRPEDIDPADIYTPVGDAPGTGSQTLAAWERRIGLARNRERKTAQEGLLYSIAHVRPAPGVRVAARVVLPQENLVPKGPVRVRLGGEGRQARVLVQRPDTWPDAPPLAVEDGRVRFRLVLTTPGRFGGSWLPPGMARDTRDGTTVWRGELKGVRVTVVSACVGKAVRVGGWDMARGRPRPLVPCVPAGSVYFCESQDPVDVVTRLHGAQLGEDTAYGFGHVLLGVW